MSPRVFLDSSEISVFAAVLPASFELYLTIDVETYLCLYGPTYHTEFPSWTEKSAFCQAKILLFRRGVYCMHLRVLQLLCWEPTGKMTDSMFVQRVCWLFQSVDTKPMFVTRCRYLLNNETFRLDSRQRISLPNVGLIGNVVLLVNLKLEETPVTQAENVIINTESDTYDCSPVAAHWSYSLSYHEIDCAAEK